MKKNYVVCFLLLVASIYLPACKKSDISGNPNNIVDLETRVNSSASGFVTDENNEPVQGATVKFGTSNTTTDQYGFFQFSNVSVPKNAAVVTVNRMGYFAGIRTFIAKEGKAAFVRIKLLPKTIAGTIAASSGGSVSLSNGLKISLPSSAVVNELTGQAYTGNITVAAHWIDPTANDLSSIMPGDLRAIDANNNFKQLITYGMAAVELTGAAGEKLQIATGKKAKITFPLPSTITGTAPANIPLWYFDEAIGLWKEEGNAIKTGNAYQGEVSHFSFWNCDVPNNYVQLDMTLKSAANEPVKYVYVKVTNIGNGQWAAGYTDSTGYVAGAVPPNSDLKVEIFYHQSCGTPLHTQNVTTTNTNLSLGTIAVTSNSSWATLSGNVINCNGMPVTSGALYINTEGNYMRYALSSTGSFSIPYNLCGGSNEPVTIIAEDYNAQQQSADILRIIIPGSNDLGSISACGVSNRQFLNITLNGAPQAFNSPEDTVRYLAYPSRSNVYATRFLNGSETTAGFNFIHNDIAVGNSYAIDVFYSSLTSGPVLTVFNVNQATSSITITEYGAIGQFIAGTYVINATQPPSNTAYAITGSFRIRRHN